jgi:adenylate cyclase
LRLLSLLESLLDDLRRRRVINVGLLYVGAAWLLVQIADVAVPALYLDAKWITVVVMLVIAGFPVAVYLAWLFDLGPDGVKRTEPGSITGLLAISISLGLLVVSTAGMSWLVIPKDDASGSDSGNVIKLAVLPFDNLSGGSGIDVLADGIPLALINQLQRVAGLRIIDRNSSFAFKGKGLSTSDIARALDVAYIISGHVLATGDQLSITTEIIDATNSITEWSNEFPMARAEAFDNLFDLQDTVARAVVGHLPLTIEGAIPNVQRTEPEAYQRYLKLITNTDISREDALKLLDEALTIDPEFAPAWVEYATWHISKNHKENSNFTAAWSAATTATVFDPDNAQAIAAQAAIKLNRDFDLVEAARLIRKARLLEPGNVEFMSGYALILQYLGRPERAFELWQQALELDPLSVEENFNMVHILIEMGEIEEASSHFETFMAAVDISEHSERTFRGRIALGRGNFKEVLEIAGDDPWPYHRVVTAQALYELNRIEDSDAVIAELVSRNDDFADYAVVLIYGYRGDVDQAFSMLDRMFVNRNPRIPDIRRVLYDLRHLRRDPRWEPLLERIGVSDEVAREALVEN